MLNVTLDVPHFIDKLNKVSWIYMPYGKLIYFTITYFLMTNKRQ